MWVSADWKDYELLDCGGGEKLERWGKYLLVRRRPSGIRLGSIPAGSGLMPGMPAPPPAAANGPKKKSPRAGR